MEAMDHILVCKYSLLDYLQEDIFAGAELAATGGGSGMKAALLLFLAAALLHAHQLQLWGALWDLWRSLQGATPPLPTALRMRVHDLGEDVVQALNRTFST